MDSWSSVLLRSVGFSTPKDRAKPQVAVKLFEVPAPASLYRESPSVLIAYWSFYQVPLIAHESTTFYPISNQPKTHHFTHFWVGKYRQVITLGCVTFFLGGTH